MADAAGYGTASSGLGFMQAGVNIYGSQQAKRSQKQMDRISGTMKRRAQALEMKRLGQQQEEVNRDAFSSQEHNTADAADRGISNSSIPIAHMERIEGDRNRRYTAIQDQKDFNKEQWWDQDRREAIAKKSQRLQQSLALFNSFLGGGASGVAQQYGSQG